LPSFKTLTQVVQISSLALTVVPFTDESWSGHSRAHFQFVGELVGKIVGKLVGKIVGELVGIFEGVKDMEGLAVGE